MTKQEILERVLDNTARPENFTDLGILQFAKHFFRERFDKDFGFHHYDIARTLFELYNPSRTQRAERQAYVLIHRDAAKTTVSSFLFPIYQIMLKGYTTFVRYERPGWEGSGMGQYEIKEVPVGEDFILICSETSSVAEEFVTSIKSEIDSHKGLIDVFGDKQPEVLQFDSVRTRKGDTTWRKNCFITRDNTIIRGVGSGQQVRGRNIRGKRPTLAVVDDMYSENNTKTEEAREKQNKWFWAQLLNSIDVSKGKIAWLGTMVHEDTVISSMKKSDLWFGIEKPVIGLEELHEVLKECERTDEECTIPSKERCDTLQQNLTSLSWPARHNLYTILTEYKKHYEIRRLRYWYMEMLNELTSPDEAKFTDQHLQFCPMDLVRSSDGGNLLHVEWKGHTWTGVCLFDIGVDVASSERTASDDTAIATIGLVELTRTIAGTSLTETKVVPILYDIEGGKYGIYDEGVKLGQVDAVTRNIQRYPVRQVNFEVAGQQGLIKRELDRHLRNKKIYTPVIAKVPAPSQKKEERITSVLWPLVQKYGCILINSKASKGVKFKIQLQALGASNHEDYPDAVAIGAENIKLPYKKVVQKVKSYIEKKKNPIHSMSVQDRWQCM